MSFVIQRVAGRQISLSNVRSDVLRIGRGTNAELRSENPAVALEHAVIQKDANGYFTITDKGSITGTYVNGRPVESARLSKGDVIEIGDLRVDVQLADPAKPLFLRIVTRQRRPAASPAAPVEEDEPVVPQADAVGPPVRAQKVDYGGALRLARPYLTKLSLVAIGLIITFTVVTEVTRPENHRAFMPGGVSSAHARARDVHGDPIANHCQACHEPWKSVSSERCMACHTRVVHSETEVGTPPCMSCHTEHRDIPKLAMVNDARCAACHADLENHAKPYALAAQRDPDDRYAFEAIRKITAFGVDHPDLVPPRDPNTVRFNHKLHLKAGGIFDATGKRVEPACTDCHRLVVSRGKSDPVALDFEQHCQSCHKLTFDARFPTAEVPHGGDPGVVYGFVLATYAGNRAIIGKSPEEIRRLLSRRAAVAPDERAVFNAEQVVKTKCALCHALTRAGGRVIVQPPVIRTNWFAGVKFTHTQHRDIGCENCHRGVRDSFATSDVLMPRQSECTRCHGPQPALAAAGAPATASSCLACHEYHLRSKPLLGTVTPMSSRRSAAVFPGLPLLGEARMIDTILILAIALLLLVVLVPIGMAIFQRLRPRPRDEERSRVQVTRPVPPLPPQAEKKPEPPPVQPEVPPPAPPRRQPESTDRTRLEGAPGGDAPAATEMVQWYGMIVCTSGPIEGQRFIVEEGGIYIGRDATLSQVVIDDGRVSKRHVRIMPRSGKVWAIDQGSTNGTFLGAAPGQNITEVQLKRGDTLVLADNAASFLYQI